MRLYSDQNVQHVQQLALVFVQTLGLRVEQGIGVEGDVPDDGPCQAPKAVSCSHA